MMPTHAVRIRRWDGQAKDLRATCPRFEAYRHLFEAYFGPQLWDHP
jgi:hypothetical protein